MLRRTNRSSLLLVVVAAACSPEHDRAARVPDHYRTLDQGLLVCPTSVVEGLDVYSGDGTINWQSVAGSGRQFAFIKASQGDYNTQMTFAADWSGAKAASMYRSPYHFFDPTIDGGTQANHFLSVLAAQGGLQPGDLPPMLDIECPTSSNQAQAQTGCEYPGNSGWVPTATLRQGVFEWLATVEAATGRKPLIYSYPSWFADVGLTDPQLANYPLFIATLSNCASVPAPWTTTVFWQYSFTGTVPGIAGQGQVDLDRFVGTAAELAAFADGGASAADAGPPDAGAPDAGSGVDAGTAGDAGSVADAGSAVDAGRADGGAPGAVGADAGQPIHGGCGCQPGGEAPGAAWLAVAALAFLAQKMKGISAFTRRR